MMHFVRCLKLLHTFTAQKMKKSLMENFIFCAVVAVIKRSSRPSINPFLVIGHIAEKHYIYITRENICGDVLQYLPWNSKKITLLSKYFSLIFLVQDQRGVFHVWGSLQRIEKTKIGKGNTFLVQPS